MTLLDIPACPFFDDTHTERLEGFGSFFHSYEFSIPSNHTTAELAVPKGLVIFPDLDGATKCFVIKTVEEESGTGGLYKRCYAEDSAIDELSCTIQLPGGAYASHTASELLTHVLAGTRWTVGNVESPAATTATVEWLDYQTAWECLLWIATEFALEVNTRVEVNGNQIVGRYIDLVEARGTYSGQILEYERDTASVSRSGDGGEVFSAMYGVGASDGDAFTTFSAVAWTVSGGDPVDKPLNQTYVAIDAARDGDPGADPPVVGYGIPLADGSFAHRYGVYRNEEESNAGRLLSQTYDELLDHITPQYRYDVRIAALERMPAQRPGDLARSWESLRVGDTVTVRDTATCPAYTAEVRVIEVRRSYSDPTQDAVILGKAERRVSDWIAAAMKTKRRFDRMVAADAVS